MLTISAPRVGHPPRASLAAASVRPIGASKDSSHLDAPCASHAIL